MNVDFQTFLAALFPTVGAILWIGAVKVRVDEHARRLDVLDNSVVKELKELREEFANLKGV